VNAPAMRPPHSGNIWSSQYFTTAAVNKQERSQKSKPIGSVI